MGVLVSRCGQVETLVEVAQQEVGEGLGNGRGRGAETEADMTVVLKNVVDRQARDSGEGLG